MVCNAGGGKGIGERRDTAMSLSVHSHIHTYGYAYKAQDEFFSKGFQLSRSFCPLSAQLSFTLLLVHQQQPMRLQLVFTWALGEWGCRKGEKRWASPPLRREKRDEFLDRGEKSCTMVVRGDLDSSRRILHPIYNVTKLDSTLIPSFLSNPFLLHPCSTNCMRIKKLIPNPRVGEQMK